MGLPLILAIGAAAIGAAALYNSSKNSSSSGGHYTDSSEEQEKAAREAERERLERERKAKIAQLTNDINKECSEARSLIITAGQLLQTSELFDVVFNNCPSDFTINQLLNNRFYMVFVANSFNLTNNNEHLNELFNEQTNNNIEQLKSYIDNIKLSDKASQICNVYQSCKQSELALIKLNEQLTNKLNQLR